MLKPSSERATVRNLQHGIRSHHSCSTGPHGVEAAAVKIAKSCVNRRLSLRCLVSAPKPPVMHLKKVFNLKLMEQLFRNTVTVLCHILDFVVYANKADFTCKKLLAQ